MNVSDEAFPADQWFVVAVSAEVPQGQVVQSFLHGQELALWRDARAGVQVWENRCPHRGTRFTLGRVVDDQLACAYHGWQFAADGHCAHIPAHPNLTPPKSVCARTYRAQERYGMIWASLGNPEAEVPAVPEIENSARRPLFCRSFVTHCPARAVTRALVERSEESYRTIAPLVLMGEADAEATPVVLIQPMNEQRSILHLWLVADNTVDDDAVLRERHVALLKTQRRHLEAGAAGVLQ